MDSKRITRARKMNTDEQENETSMSTPISRSSEMGMSSTHTWDHASAPDTTHDPLTANMRNCSSAHEVNIDDSNRNVNTARQGKRATLLAQLEFEQLESERIAARAAAARTKMLLLRLEVDKEDLGNLIECDNASHLSETDKLEKMTVALGDIEPAPDAVYLSTGDESWIYIDVPETKQQSTVWVFQDEPSFVPQAL
ncbi:hypothetical protein EVAR_75551_1 [Eumeta japonica]|uniref:Uncharacterized protein n=1 Tax=Eumeta variegata TaxID=151549 RepID=A0A4C1UJC0_EUMVA|nr:hypothetical protein EVAR_75551_1 [Eumeta japonica]